MGFCFVLIFLHVCLLIGDLIYNRVDSEGCRIYAICSPTCDIERHSVHCNVITSPATYSPEWSTVTTSVPLPPTSTSAPVRGCVSSVYPPLQVCNFCVIF